MKLANAALWLAVLLNADLAAGRELWKSGDRSLELTGSLRELALVTKGTDQDDFAAAVLANPVVCGAALTFEDCPAFALVNDADVWTSLTRLRLKLEAQLGSGWSAVVTWDNELRAGSLDTFEASLGEAFEPETWLDADHQERLFGLGNGDEAEWRTLLYRGYVNYESKRVELTLGRQRIPWGVGRLWNPIDRFNAIAPLALQPDQSGGVDALAARWLFSGFTFLELVLAPQSDFDDGS